jgi:hypothetical protein
MSDNLKVGDLIRWAHDYEECLTYAIGTIIAVIPSDNNLKEFTMYDIVFEFGLRTLYGSHIAPA